MQSVIIRCAASATVGLGHLVRCRVLGKEIKARGYNPVMVGPPLSVKNTEDDIIFLDWLPREEWLKSEDEAGFHLDLMRKFNAQHIVIDDYRSDGIHQKILREHGIRIVQQYDASKVQHFAAHFLVNGSPYERADFYQKDALYDDIDFLLGPKYSILRPIFSEVNLKNAKKDKKVLMTFGGGSDRGVICLILEKFGKQIIEAGWHISVVVGPKNDNIETISSLINNLGYNQAIEILVNPKNMAEIMAKCRFAIMGGGTSIFEAAYLGIPALLIPIADNQINQCKGWESLGGMKYISSLHQFNHEKFNQNLITLLKNSEVIKSRRKELETVIDADGYLRILDKLLDNKINGI